MNLVRTKEFEGTTDDCLHKNPNDYGLFILVNDRLIKSKGAVEGVGRDQSLITRVMKIGS